MTQLELAAARNLRLQKFYRERHECLHFKMPPVSLGEYLIAYDRKKYGINTPEINYAAFSCPELYTDKVLDSVKSRIMFHSSPSGQIPTQVMTVLVQFDQMADTHIQFNVNIENFSEEFESKHSGEVFDILVSAIVFARNGSRFVDAMNALEPYKRKTVTAPPLGFGYGS